MPKFFYFLVNFALLIPLVYFNFDKFKSNPLFTGFYIFVTLLTYILYFQAALSDPGYINSIMFNKAYQHNNETENNRSMSM